MTGIYFHMELFGDVFFLSMNGDNVTKDGIWTVVELWLEVQQRSRICESAPLHYRRQVWPVKVHTHYDKQ